MRQATILLAFLAGTNSFAQQYPFVHYSPKDGLVSNQVRKFYQDSRGRLYFLAANGLSVYDGARFTNYSRRNGLVNDIVNCVIEMGPDSVWVVTNSPWIFSLVNGVLKPLRFNRPVPVIENLRRDEAGRMWAATEQGLHLFEHGEFRRLPLVDTAGQDINRHITTIIPVGQHLLIRRDHSLIPNERRMLYLYDISRGKIVDQLEGVYSFNEAPGGGVWISIEKKIVAVNQQVLMRGRLLLDNLPEKFHQISNLGSYFIFSDGKETAWVSDQSHVLIQVDSAGNLTYFDRESGLSLMYINSVFYDRENNLWIAGANAGVDKLVSRSLSILEKPFGLSAVDQLWFDKNERQLILYSSRSGDAIAIRNNQPVKAMTSAGIHPVTELVTTRNGIFGIRENRLYRMTESGSRLVPRLIFTDTIDESFHNPITDKNGNLIVCGRYRVTWIVNGGRIGQERINYYADQAALDRAGNIWLATRDAELVMYRPHPDRPGNYLEKKFSFKKELQGISPRSLAIDREDRIWIGTRSHGIYVFRFQNETLTREFILNSSSGLSEDFITHLAADDRNNVWASSASGLDKIHIRDGKPVVENLTTQNNIYQKVFKTVIDENGLAWVVLGGRIIRINPEKQRPENYSPDLIVSLVTAGKDTVTNQPSLSYRRNSLSFAFAATSFVDEKQILYSYRLKRGGSGQWSEPSGSNSVSFLDLRPGDYTLTIRARFPAGRYPDKELDYHFSILPPWWQSWWFRVLAVGFSAALVLLGFRFYYKRKMERRVAILERQQMIERERTRIATDMHDDLGAGLSRIKFLSETIGLKKQQQQPIEEEISRIREYSHEMIDKMGEIVWALNEKNDSLSDLLSYTRAYAVEYLVQNGIECHVEVPDALPQTFVTGEFRRNVFLTIKESLHNIVKHAQASEVWLRISVNHHLEIAIRDNGIGFDENNIRPFSAGLSNMKYRIRELGGRLDIERRNGTEVSIAIPFTA